VTVDIDLTGRRMLIIGGSSGIGRAAALTVAAAGARIAVVGRDREKLDEVIASAGTGTAIAADITEPDRCGELVERAAQELGGFDVLLFASGVTSLQPVGRIEPPVLHEIFATNAFAPALIADAALERLADDGVMLFLSSTSASAGYQALGPYGASKAALERLVGAIRLEHPEHRCVTVTVGDTLGTDIARSYDPELVAALLPTWLQSAVMYKRHMEVDDVGRMLAELMALLLGHPDIAMPHVALVPPGGMRSGTVDEFMADMAP
jgi:NAD(P)-dependent dehydrogenase (short-subunit alcohol dehydrogenase family)